MQDKTFHLKPWTPKVVHTAESLMAKMSEVAPELEMLFMGAAALGLPGKNDIDIDILCDAADVKSYTKKLFPVLGRPKVAKKDLTRWVFN